MYNSKLYKPISEELLNNSQQLTDQNVLYPSDQGGWRLVNSLNIEMITTLRSVFAECTDGQQAYMNNAFTWKVQVKFPDGSEKLFLPLGYGQVDEAGYATVSPNGYLHGYG
jgi:hypothetical protein